MKTQWSSPYRSRSFMWNELPTELRRGIICMGKDICKCEFIKHKKSFKLCVYQLKISLWGIDAKGYLSYSRY